MVKFRGDEGSAAELFMAVDKVEQRRQERLKKSDEKFVRKIDRDCSLDVLEYLLKQGPYVDASRIKQLRDRIIERYL